MDTLARVRQFVREHDLIRSGGRVVAAVSGGSDSVALAHVLRELHLEGELELVGIAHFNHQLRTTARRDEDHVAALADAFAVPLLADREDIAARARAARVSIEQAAHDARYAFFDRARRHFGADAVALGHTRDDQAETFVLRLLRGAGPRGLGAMRPRHDGIVRPLLHCGRDELRAYLIARAEEGARATTYVDDESNTDVAVPRNRVRAELLPLLRDRFNPSIVDVFADEAEMAADLWQWLDGAAARAVPVARLDDRRRAIDIRALGAQPLALQRVVVWRAMNELAAGRPIGFAHVRAALRVASADGPPVADLPGQRVQRNGDRLVLTGRAAGTSGRSPVAANLFRYALSIPGEVQVAEIGCAVSAQWQSRAADLDRRAMAGNGPVAAVRFDGQADRSLIVRNRRPGDRFRPFGLRGEKKLQDFFVDLKIPRIERDTVPVVVDEQNRIVWVGGHRIDEAFRVTEPADHVLLLRITRV